MKFKKLLLVVAGLMLMASASMAQNVAEIFYYGPDAGTSSLTVGCPPEGDPTPLDGSWTVWIYRDFNNNNTAFAGPCVLDPGDGPVVVGQLNGEATINSFAINEALGPGSVYNEELFQVAGSIPTQRHYLVILCPDGSPHYVSSLMLLGAGVHATILSDDDWTCCECQFTPPCDADENLNVEWPGGHSPIFGPISYCVDVCDGSQTYVCLMGFGANHIPHAHVRPGCLPNPTDLCDVTSCPPADCQLGPWFYEPTSGSWYAYVYGFGNGCCCFTIDYIEPAAAGQFDAIARDNSVQLNWNTLAETGVDYFEVRRAPLGSDAEVLTTVDAVNEATGSNYSYLDESARNGVTYEYSIVTVNLDGSREDWGVTVSATPSSSNAVITEYALQQNFPNPFNPSTSIVFDVVEENTVDLTVYNAMGQQVAKLVNGETMGNGRHTIEFSANNLTSGDRKSVV